MPWIEGNEIYPSFYVLPPALSDRTVLGDVRASEFRKVAAREKDCLENDKATRRWWAKKFKGYDYVCKFYEGRSEYISWRTPMANPDLAPFIDQAFLEIEYGNLGNVS